MTLRSAQLVAGSLLTSLVLLHARPAAACSAPACVEGGPLAAEAASIPANAPGFVFSTGWPRGSALEEDAALPQLVVRRDGVVVPTHVVAVAAHDPSRGFATFDQLVVPDAPLALGAYTLEYDARCATERTLARNIEVVPAAQYPTELGTVTAEPLPEGPMRLESGASCTEMVRVAAVRLTLQRSAGAEAFASAGFVEVSVDGQPWRGVVADGYPHGAGSPGAPTQFDPLVVYVACPGQQSAGGLAEGVHSAEVRMHIEGAASQPAPASVAFTLQCGSAGPDGGAADGGTMGDGGTGGLGGPAGSDPSVDGASAESAGGCSSARSLDGLAWLTPLALLVGLRRRRR